MTITAIKEKLHNYIDEADQKKLEFIYALVQDDIDGSDDHWADPQFLAEMESRLHDLEIGSMEGRDWQQILQEVRATYGQ